MCVQVQLGEMPEHRLVARNRLIKRSKAGGQNLDAVEFGACVVEGAKELLLDLVDSLRPFPLQPLLPVYGVKAIAERWFLFSNN